MAKKFKETYVLNVAKWRCGGAEGESPNTLGVGDTCMINSDGYMCCLGQFAKRSGVSYNKSHADNYPDPFELAKGIGHAYDANFVESDMYGYANTDLSDDMIEINDDCRTTPKEKIQLIREKLAENGIGLRVINASILD